MKNPKQGVLKPARATAENPIPYKTGGNSPGLSSPRLVAPRIEIDSRPGGPPAKHSPARKGWVLMEEEPSAVGAALYRAAQPPSLFGHAPASLRRIT